jgi:hypothetical protein
MGMKLLIPGTSRPLTLLAAKTIGLQARHPEVDVEDINWWVQQFAKTFIRCTHTSRELEAWGAERQIPSAILHDAEDLFCDAAVREAIPDIGVSPELLRVLAMTGMKRLNAESVGDPNHCEVSIYPGPRIQVRLDSEGVGFSLGGTIWYTARDQSMISPTWDRFVARAVDQGALRHPLRQFIGPDATEFRVDNNTGIGHFTWLESGRTMARYQVTPAGDTQYSDPVAGIPPFAENRTEFEKLLLETYERALYSRSARHLRRHLYQGNIVEHYQLSQGLHEVGGYRFPCEAKGQDVLVTLRSQTYRATATISSLGNVAYRQHIGGTVLNELDLTRLFQKQLHKFVRTNKTRLVELATAVARGI